MDDGGIFQTYHMVIIRIRCCCEYENALKNAANCNSVIFTQFFPCSKTEAVRNSSENMGFAASLVFKSGLSYLTPGRLGQVIKPLHFDFLICKMGITLNHILDDTVKKVCLFLKQCLVNCGFWVGGCF